MSEQGLNIADVFSVFFKRFKMILGVTLLFALLGAVYVSFQRPVYTASAFIHLNVNEQNPVMQNETMRIDDDAALRSELDVLRSPELTARVISELKLYQKAEFNPLLRAKTKVSSLIGETIGENGENLDQEINRVRILRNVQNQVSFTKNPLSYTVRIDFTSRFPSRAKNIANGFANEYLKYQIEMREARSREANAWLARRVDSLRRDVVESERAVQRFSEENGLFELNGMTLDNRQLSDLNTQLSKARADLAQSEAKLAQANEMTRLDGTLESVPDVLNAPLIQRLREQEATLLRKISEMAGHFGPKHPEMSRVKSELTDLRAKIDAETRKIVKGLENEVAVAQAQVDGFEVELSRLRDKLGVSTQQSIELEELKRNAQVNRAMYEAFLTRFKETGEAINLRQSSAKIIARAQLPLSPSAPNKPLIMALFVMLGGFISMTLALLLSVLTRGFTSPAHVEEVLEMETIGMVPEVSYKQNGALSDMVVQHPSTVEAETLRGILARLNPGDGRRSFLVMSSLPQEGKGSISSSLARVMAQSSKKVLLIDCDLHRKSICEGFDKQAASMLNAYLKGHAEIRDIIARDAVTGLDYIGSESVHGTIQTLLESDAMKELMDYAHRHYDAVFIDAPPVIGLSDVFFLSRLVDQALFVVRYGDTPRRVAANAILQVKRADINVAGAILSRVPPQAHKALAFGSDKAYKAYGDYYEDAGKRKKPNILPFKARG